MASAAAIEDIVSGAVDYPVKSKPLWVPSLEDDVLPSLQAELVKHFENVEVTITFLFQLDCTHNLFL